MSINLRAALLAAAACAGLSGPAGATTLTYTAFGIVKSGTDQAGAFGAAGGNLAGDPFVTAYTIDDTQSYLNPESGSNTNSQGRRCTTA
jgi:hypothetical protein